MRGDGAHNGRVYSAVEDTAGLLFVGMQPAPDSVVFASPDSGDSWFSTGGLDAASECLCLLRVSDGTIYAGTTPNGDVFRHACQAGTGQDRPGTPARCCLFQNYPNPFNSTTHVRFQLPDPRRVTIRVYDVLGHPVKTLVSEDLGPGDHSVAFAGVDDDGKALAGGVYVYRMEAGDFTSVKKFVFLH
jgi:hypothetical protein